jgi:multiple sugar transport system substrate-binding protein
VRTGSGRRVRTTALLTAALLAGGLLAACDSSSAGSSASSAPTTASSATSAPPQLPKQTLTFGVVGTTDEVDQYRQMAALFAPLNRQVTVQVQSWPDDAAMMAALRAGAKVPDVLLASRRDLSWLSQHQEVQPVDGFLDDRGFDFGDEYPRSALTAFSGDNRLECLHYGVAPSVIF